MEAAIPNEVDRKERAEKGGKLTSFFKQNASFLAYIVFVLLTEMCTFYALLSHYESGWNILLLGMSALLACVSVVFFVRLFLKYRGRLEVLFVLVAIPLGLLFAFFMLPTQAPDELSHIYRLFGLITMGYNVYVPDAILEVHVESYSQLWLLLSQSTDYSSGIIVDSAAGGYSSVLYVIPTIGMSIGRLFGMNMFVSIILARICNLAAFIVCGYVLLKKIPFAKTILFVYLLNPMLLQQQASCSGDALTNIVTLSFIVVFVCIYSKKDKTVTRTEVLVLLGLLVLLLFCKFIYVLLALLLLAFIPRIKSNKVKFGVIGGLFVVFVGALFVMVSFAGRAGVVSGMVDLLLDPVEFVRVYWRTFEVQTTFYLASFAGGYLGLLNILPPNVWLIYWALLLVSIFVSNYKETDNLPKLGRVAMIIVGVVLAILIPLSLRSWGMEADGIFDYLSGAQGRYFIPAIILFLLGAFSAKLNVYSRNADIVLSALLIFIAFFDIFYVVRAFNF